MKKLMIAAAVAAMGAGAFAGECEPEEVLVARIYQMQMNVYTTKGVLSTYSTTSICAPGEETCTVRRGKDKTVIRGYLYTCSDLCELADYATAFADSKRKALFGEIDSEFSSTAEFAPTVMNFMGVNNTDVEIAWTFDGTVNYGGDRAQEYKLVGAGYGVLGSGATIFPDKMSGYFAGTVTAPYDLKNKQASECACEPSKVLTCETYGELAYEAVDSIAFGAWKIRFNANDSKAYLSGKWNPVTAIKKIMQ